jgi:phenylalanyl-tRNA synthetase alpha subunit
MSDLEQLAAEARAAIADADDGPALEALRVDYLGKKGRLTALLKGLGACRRRSGRRRARRSTRSSRRCRR